MSVGVAERAGSRAAAVVRFESEIELPEPGGTELPDAAEAVRQEYRISVKCKRLRCRSVTPVAGRSGESIYVLEVGHAVQFDWTWEGAVAFRPLDVESFDGHSDLTDAFLSDPASDRRQGTWCGEVVEVDEANGRIFVWTGENGTEPTTGSFFVKPFDFLAHLNAAYNSPEFAGLKRRLPARLHAARGHVHPSRRHVAGGVPELRRMWGHAWGVLWGPPGTGKTYTLGRQAAACFDDSDERILVVSTTNKATDEAALSIGRAARSAGSASAGDGRMLRIGKGAHYEMYEGQRLTGLLRGTETDLLRRIGELTGELHRAATSEEKAVLRKQINGLRREMKDAAFNVFASADVRVVVATAFKAMSLLCDPEIRNAMAGGAAPFTTVFIDEAGLISRAAAAALSLLASRRVILVGDSKQLAPISRISRVLPTSQATWLASSGLSHLTSVGQAGDGVHLLREQHRMHPHVCAAVSAYQYGNTLTTAPSVSERKYALPALLAGQPRAVWYVLDEEGGPLPSIRAERGPGNKSWIRPKTREVLDKLFSDESVRKARGLFISPFVAQARDIRSYLAERGIGSWSAATVHSQQGTEADLVVFDTVNAGSTSWPFEEWKRLVNVGLSRAREFVLVLSSRAEMREPYLSTLTTDLAPRVLRGAADKLRWERVEAEEVFEVPAVIASNPDLLGSQIAGRKNLRPVLSREQQRLCGLKMDGKPRLVRGVAGSGKTVVLAHWLLKTARRLRSRPDARFWAVYANQTLGKLIRDTIDGVWQAEGDGPPPWGQIHLCHVRDLLGSMLLPQVGLWMRPDEFDYDRMSAEFLRRRGPDHVTPCCQALFVDEAQDMGPNTLKLLSALVERTDGEDPNSRSVNIFYDNAQNVYGRSTPKWVDLGLDLRGRSTVMKESFRATNPITEYALNVLYRLRPPKADADHRELVERGLIEKTDRDGRPWWNVRFNQVEGPTPTFKRYSDLDAEVDAIGGQLVRWIRDEGVRPGDICVLYNGKRVAGRIEQRVSGRLAAVGAGLARRTTQGFDGGERAVTLTTAQSFKGYEAEAVVVAAANEFVAKGAGPLPESLYVAMTRARSVLAVSAHESGQADKAEVLRTLDDCYGLLRTRPAVEKASERDEFEDLVREVGEEHRAWLGGLWGDRWIKQEPLTAPDGEILAEPAFWFEDDEATYACFGKRPPSRAALHRLEDAGITLLRPGDRVSRGGVPADVART